jgi:hypothetical protein
LVKEKINEAGSTSGFQLQEKALIFLIDVTLPYEQETGSIK